MKKFCLILAACLVLAGNVRAENFVEALGAECGRILVDIKSYGYARKKSEILSQYQSLEICMKLFKDNGGNFEELNQRYAHASLLRLMDWAECSKKKDDICEMARINFNSILDKGLCGEYDLLKRLKALEMVNPQKVKFMKEFCESNKTVDK